MTGKRRAAAAMLCAAVLLLGGCGLFEQFRQQTGWAPQEPDAISIAADGSITEIVQETLDQSYYDAEELESMIHSSVEEHNQENGEDAVRVADFTADGGTVTLELEYASGDDYAAFNNVAFFSGSIIGAQLEGYLFDTSFYKIRDGVVSGGEKDGSAVLENMAAQVLVVTAPLEVHVDGRVTFISTNAEMISADTVFATGETEEKETLVLPSSAVYTGEEESYAEQKAAKRVYIIYETE